MPAEKIVTCRFRAMNLGDIEATDRCHTIAPSKKQQKDEDEDVFHVSVYC